MARILIADDDRVVRATMSYLLGTRGHDVVEAAGGREGLARIASEHFDLLIVDIFMPDMDGLETIKRVLNHYPALPILVVSGMTLRSGSGSTGPPDFLAMATKLGAVQTLRKPFRASEFLTAVDDCLNIPGEKNNVERDYGQDSFKHGA
jgi:CheY-like chemotaxis protein